MRDAALRGKVSVIGIGQSSVGRVPGRSPLGLAADAARNAIADAGLSKADLDGVLSSHAFASPFHRFSVAFSEYFGIQPTFSNT
jgi:3-oxoacyl-[acyl-carrier-protein] synthase III